jgi:hypothetical protein
MEKILIPHIERGHVSRKYKKRLRLVKSVIYLMLVCGVVWGFIHFH